MEDAVPIETTLTKRQYRLLRSALIEQLDYHHSEADPELAAEYRELLHLLAVED